MSESARKEHPATFYNKVRHHAFSLYEKNNDPDETLSYIFSKYKLIPTLKAGLRAEILAYHEYRESMSLEPLLDAGVKADFTGMKNGVLTNFDVTTNIAYKDINDYKDVIIKREKPYEIILMKEDNFEFFPLRFPICKGCGNFSHYILFMSEPQSEVFWHASTTQVLIEYCPYCYSYRELEYFSYIFYSLNIITEELFGDQMYPETRRPQCQIKKIIKDETTNIVRFFEKSSGKLLSALSEGDYIITDPRSGDGYHGGRVYWVHPLANSYIENIIDYSY